MSSVVNSPFYIIEDAISPSRCDRLVQELGLAVPSIAESGKPLKHERLLSDAELLHFVHEPLREHADAIEQRFGGTIVNVETPVFQQYFENPKDPCEPHGCASSKFLRKKWIKHKDIDLVGYLWLKDYQGGVPLDPRFETYGGKLEFPAFDFSLLPQRGTLVLFPAGPHFITAVSHVLVGSLAQVKIGIKLEDDGGMWLYQPQNFPGTYQDWFNEAS